MDKYSAIYVIILSDDPMRPEYLLHKVILAATSSFFRKLFHHEPKKVYDIGMVSKSGFDSIMGYTYLQTLTVTRENFDDIKATAEYLGCDEIAQRMTGGIGNLVRSNTAICQYALSHLTVYHTTALPMVRFKGRKTIYCPMI